MAAYRRRSDGIVEIVRPRPTSKWKGLLSNLAAAVSLALIPAVALGVYVSLGMPLLLVVAVLAAIGFSWVTMRRRHSAAGSVRGATLRLSSPVGRASSALRVEARTNEGT